jgi:amyloid beta precursor protein binding protein 1
MLPSSQEKKYDRQLRLWGSHGQIELQKSSVLLVGSNFTGCETLKNLVLPGIGRFTIIDDHVVTEVDAGSNFFLKKTDVGLFRAECVAKLIQELNPDVQFSCKTKVFPIHQKSSEIITANPAFLSDYSLVVVCEIVESDLLKLAKSCRDFGIPIVYARSYGMFGYLRVDMEELCIIESHPESFLDLRLDKPWHELEEFAGSFDLACEDSHYLTHIPYPVAAESDSKMERAGQNLPS